MNQQERKKIKNKLDKLQIFIKEQHRLPKNDRDKKRLKEALQKSIVLGRWLKE